MTKKELKTRSKSWLTGGILTSVKKTNKIYNKFCKVKDQTRKQHHQIFKTFRNSLVNLTIKYQENSYKKDFEGNKTNMIKVWKGIKEIILINKYNKT